MRNAMQLSNGFIVTTDNSGAIGEKEQDIVQVPDDVTSYYSARVTLLEQWAAGAEPEAIIMHNFSSEASWERYVKGITWLFDELSLPVPPIKGSSETNMPTLQSGVAVTMIGAPVRPLPEAKTLQWFTFGKPLVGNELLEQPKYIANLLFVKNALDTNIVERVWPVGSKGIFSEVRRLLGDFSFTSSLDCEKTAGPATVILLGISEEKMQAAEQHFGPLLERIIFD
ncbi:alpha-ribazole-5-phosphate synthase [Viridibacillus sp. YIM B01967]|uniref:Alpha-ribazole-5-phosphate synthase n=1 Tax=Viridibacillus soli TaxID=2798301 RepID=A0ABS1H8C3_9BACL|nr:alpha-ribazole-5-phosphate synthase [Viridibacillus soli]MBK3495668.1 alpha-ribazole-5-phosphate synthase [Viridibacillus soli]